MPAGGGGGGANSGGGDGSLHGEPFDVDEQEGNNKMDTLQRIRNEIMNVFRDDFHESGKTKKDSPYIPSGRIQHDLLNYWLQD